MRIQPRQDLLRIWRAVAQSSYVEGEWLTAEKEDFDSVRETQRLLCLMFPAGEVRLFRLERPDETDAGVLNALDVLGGPIEIPRKLLRILIDYFERHSDENGNPLFGGGPYFVGTGTEPPTQSQRAIDVTESFALGVTLALAVLGFAKTFQQEVTRPAILEDIALVERLASTRLTAAMVGLHRSFTVYAFDAGSAEGRSLLGTINQDGRQERRVVKELRDALADIAAGLRDISSDGGGADLEGSNQLFECGWSWSVIEGVPPIENIRGGGEQRPGVALDAPYLYFTTIALDGIADLFSARTLRLGLLDDEQQRLAQDLEVRWELTQRYWQTLATFGSARWPLEDIPWATTDSERSDYFSLLVSAIVTRDMVDRRASDADLFRLGRVLAELAKRGRITMRPLGTEDAVRGLHSPGLRVGLSGAEKAGGPKLGWIVADFSAVLLKRIVRIAALIRDVDMRDELIGLADAVWEHLERRRLTEGPAAGLWDQALNIFTGADDPHGRVSWHHTVRVVEALVGATVLVDSDPPRSPMLAELARHSLSEAERIVDAERLSGGGERGPAVRDLLNRVRADIGRARDIQLDRPATAVALLQECLRQLDRIASAREGATWIG